MPAVLTASDARHWALLTRAALAARRTEIDALNVFPVPDGDTGTNLYLTFDAAIDEVVSAHEAAGILGEATLVQECIDRARALGRRRLVLSTQPAMYAAQRVYERAGFTRAPGRDWSPVPGLMLMAYELDLEDA